MSRLIDADALMEELHHMIEGDADLRKDYEYMGIDDCIRSMPTAYDTEKVVAELEKEKAKGIYDYDSVANITDAWARAINIVKRGGVE